MDFSLKTVGLWLLILVAVLVLLNIFVIMPHLSLKPELIPTIQKEFAERVERDAVVFRVDSLAVIKKNDSGRDVIQSDSIDQTFRNPFFWPEEKPQQKKAKKAVARKTVVQKPVGEKPEPEKPQLSMVIIGKGRKQAMLDNVFIREGDMFHGYLVKRIVSNEVILSDEFGELSIILDTSEGKSGQDLPPEVLIERQ